MYNLQEYKDSYKKKLESLWQYHRNDANDNITDCKTFKLKTKKNSRRTPVVCNTEDVQERAVLLKYVSNFCRTLQIPLINCEKNTMLGWSKSYIITTSIDPGTFAITYAKLYVPVVTQLQII